MHLQFSSVLFWNWNIRCVRLCKHMKINYIFAVSTMYPIYKVYKHTEGIQKVLTLTEGINKGDRLKKNRKKSCFVVNAP